jgi:hypothetical protein
VFSRTANNNKKQEEQLLVTTPFCAPWIFTSMGRSEMSCEADIVKAEMRLALMKVYLEGSRFRSF